MTAQKRTQAAQVPELDLGPTYSTPRYRVGLIRENALATAA